MCSNGWKLFLERRIQTSLETDTPGADETSTLQSICDNGKIAKSEATWKGWFIHVCHFLYMLWLVLICFDVRSNVFTLDGNWTLRVSTESLQGGLRYRWGSEGEEKWGVFAKIDVFLRQLGLGGSAWTWTAQNDNTWQEIQVDETFLTFFARQETRNIMM